MTEKRGTMLQEIQSLNKLPIAQLLPIYLPDNSQEGKKRWPDESTVRQLALAEDSFRDYLRWCFFKTPGARYFLWTLDSVPVSALRCEPYRDGVLLSALATDPNRMNNGYATLLVEQVIAALADRGVCKIYAHIHRRNQASIRVHQKTGFIKLREGAVLLDGSYHNHYDTYLRANSP